MGGGVVAGLYPKVHRPLALLCLFASCLAIFSNFFHPLQADFMAYWAAGVLAVHGHAAGAYDPAQLAAVQDRIARFETGMPFGYPPTFLLVTLPLGLLPYAIAMGAWVVGMAAAFMAAVKRLLPDSSWLAMAFPPAALNGMVGQNGLLTGTLVACAAINMAKRPFVAGLFLGCLVIKPQLAILVPLAFVAGGQWRAFAGAAVSSVGLALLALLCFGPGSYLAMTKMMPLFTAIVADGLTGWFKMASVYGSLRLAGMGSHAAWVGHIAIAAGATAMLWVVWRGRHDVQAKFATLVAASMLVTPYLYVYDTVMLVVPFFWLATQGADRRLLAALWLVPAISIAQNWGFNDRVDLMPLLPIGLLAMIGARLFAVPRSFARPVFAE